MYNYQVYSVLCGGHRLDIPNIHTFDNTDNTVSPCEAYQHLLQDSNADVLIYLHDDVIVHDPDWSGRVMTEFSNPDCVAVGFGGALSLGRPDLYRVPYAIQNMARGDYISNQDDAEIHGRREKGRRRVAVLDAFAMAVRRDFLISVGGWPVKHLTHHCLDLWLACEAARAGKEIWMIGISALHEGGGSSTKATYATALWKQGGTLQSDHQVPHRWLADNYRDVLPLRVR